MNQSFSGIQMLLLIQSVTFSNAKVFADSYTKCHMQFKNVPTAVNCA